MKTLNKPTGMNRLFVRVRDKSQPITIDKINNIQNIPIRWKEVSNINLGSKKVPNKEIFEVKWVWEKFEPDGSRQDDQDFLRRFFS